MDKKRRPTPVAVFHFVKKRSGTASRTQTIPEVRVNGGFQDEPTVSMSARELSRLRPADDVVEGLNRLAELGHQLFSRGRLHEAKVIFEGLLLNRPTDAFSHTMLGTIALAQGALDRALVLFEEALKLAPGDVAALVYRGEIRFKQRRLKQAMLDFKQAISLGAAGDPFVHRARKLLRMGRRLQRPKSEELG